MQLRKQEWEQASNKNQASKKAIDLASKLQEQLLQIKQEKSKEIATCLQLSKQESKQIKFSNSRKKASEKCRKNSSNKEGWKQASKHFKNVSN